MRFLITDDSPVTRRMLISDIQEKREKMGKGSSDVYFEAEDGMEALSIIKSENIDIILLDWSMPRLDGLKFVKTIREDPNLEDKIVIMVTSQSSQDMVLKAIKTGVDGYVLKPFTPDDIWTKIHPFIKNIES